MSASSVGPPFGLRARSSGTTGATLVSEGPELHKEPADWLGGGPCSWPVSFWMKTQGLHA